MAFFIYFTLPFALFPRHSDLRNPFLSLNLLFFSTALLPAFHHTWVYAGSGNANFFYAITLLWGLGGALLLLDVVHAWLRRGVEMYVQRDATKWRDVAFVMK